MRRAHHHCAWSGCFAHRTKLGCFVAIAPGNDDWSEKRPPALLPTAVSYSIFKRNYYFGYLNSGAAFSASLVVFIDASHLLFLLSKRTLTDDGDTAT